MGASTTESSQDTSPTVAAATDALPNWRTFALPIKGDAQSLANITARLQKRPAWSTSAFEESIALYDKFVSCSDSYVAPGIREALNALDHAYRLYGPHSVICSFNGGKDAVVILQLMRAAHANYYRSQQQKEEEEENGGEGTSANSVPVRPRALYFEHADEFPEIISYLQDCVQDCDLDFIAFEQGVKFNQGLEVLVHNNVPPSSTVVFPMAFVLGTRAGDPNAGDQGYFAPSSHYMPPFMRVNPVLEWTYGQVWHFLRVFSLSYCELYDQGYTSLGTTKDTFPCPALAVPGSSSSNPGGLPKFWPAYMLKDYSQERAGRVKKEKGDKKKQTVTNNNGNKLASPPMSVQDSVVTTASVLRTSDPKEVVGNNANNPVAAPPITSFDASSIKATSELAAPIATVPDDSQSCFSYDETEHVVQRTAGLLVIGDEILKGATADTNTRAAAKAFREHSVLLKRVVVVSDCMDSIVKEIRSMQKEVDIIVTSGGVGPTHDDVTIKSVAAALNRDMELHEEMATLLQEKMNKDTVDSNAGGKSELTEAQRKMATLPSRSKLRYLSDSDQDGWPVLQCRNIFVLPGVPEFFIQKIEHVAEYVSSGELERSAIYKVVLSVDEAAIVSVLNSAVELHDDVTFGSYPFVSHPDFKTVLTLEGRLRNVEATPRQSFSKNQMDNNVRLALDYLLTNLPEGSILRVENDDSL